MNLLSWFSRMFVKIVLYRMLGIGYWRAVLSMFAGGLWIPIGIAEVVRQRWPAAKPVIGMTP